MNFTRKISLFMLAVLLIAALSAGCSPADKTETVYQIYFGLIDADTGAQEISAEDASEYIRGLIESYGYGYTEFRTYGAYMENGSARGSDTLVYMIMLADGADVEEISKQAAEQLNLASVLCQKEEREYEFFAGEEKPQ